MKNNIIRFVIVSVFLLVLSNTYVMAQFPGGGGGNGPGGPNGGGMGGTTGSKGSSTQQQQPAGNGGFSLSNLQNMMSNVKMNIGHVYGKIVDGKSKKGVEFASVALYTLKGDSLTGGMLTETNGDFSMSDLPLGGYKLKISYIGYTPVEKQVILTSNKAEQDIGDIVIAEDSKMLKEVNITAEKSALELKPDRKVFNVDKDLSARGGTGIDVMKNIPGVSTDADGNVTLRNSTPQVYVDGKPTTLTLEQIPADQIDKVEVITNPSAKFEASSGGGIINVVMKKNLKPGYNGMASAVIGTNAQYNGMALINLREKKFGAMLTYNINGNTNKTGGYTKRTNLSDGRETSTYDQEVISTNKRMFQFVRAGLDFYITNRNTLSLSENMVFGKFGTDEAQTFTTGDSSNPAITNGTRQNTQNNWFHNFTTNVELKHTYPKPDKEWNLVLNYNRTKGGSDFLYTTNNYYPGATFPFNPDLQNGSGGQYSDMFTGQWDFTTPLPKNMKLEFGFRSNYKRTVSNLGVGNYSYADSLYHRDSVLSNNYKIDDLVNAAYITFSHAYKGFSYQLGLRFEESYYAGSLLDKGQTFSYQYPSSGSKIYESLFPSLNLSQKFGEKHELQFNVTRKINRPNFFQISPFVFYSDKFNYRIGNPQLQPEFNNKAELNYNLIIPKFNWLSSVYGTYSEQPITQYNYTSPSDSLVLINTFVNGKNSFSYGWENTIKVSPLKGLDITADGNVYYLSLNSNIAGESFRNSGISWYIKGMITYKIPVIGVNAQINGTYEAPKVIAQGNTLQNYFFDVSISKDLGIVSFNLSVSDVLNSRRFGTYNSTATYTQDTSRRRDTRYAKLGITVRFGKMDSSIFKLKKLKNQLPSGDDMGY